MEKAMRAIVFLTVALVAGCATLEGFQGQKNSSAASGVRNGTKQQAVPAGEEKVIPFQRETIYDLLVAETAAQNQRYDITLGNYLKQANETGDPGVAARAYSFASYLGARQAAREAARLWLLAAPDDLDALRVVAIEQVYEGQLLQAMDNFSRVKAGGEEALFLFLAERSEGLSASQREALLKRYSAQIRKYPEDRGLLLGRSILLALQGRAEQALVQVNRLLQKEGESPEGLLIKARILLQLKQPELAVALLNRAVSEHPKSVRLRLLYAQVLISKGDLTGAQRHFRELVRLRPGSPELLLQVSLGAMENGMPGEAGVYLQRLARIPGQANIANLYLGRLAVQMDDWQDARRYFRKVTPGEHFFPAYAELVRMLADRERWGMVRSDLQFARKQYPEMSVNLYLMEAEILQEQQQLEEARKIYNQGLKAWPDNTDLLYARAMLAEKVDDVKNLERDLRRIIKNDPENAAALNALGYTLIDRNLRINEARVLVEKAYKLSPEDASIIDSMGWLEYRSGNLELAVRYLRDAYARFDDAEVAAHLGEVLWMKGEKAEAQKIWDNALEKQPDSEVLKTTIERLQGADDK